MNEPTLTDLKRTLVASLMDLVEQLQYEEGSLDTLSVVDSVLAGEAKLKMDGLREAATRYDAAHKEAFGAIDRS